MTVTAPSWELQKAVIAFLVADVDMKALVGNDPCRIFDDIPAAKPNQSLTPYVMAGDEQENNIGAECMPGSGHMFALTVVSDSVGFKESKLIAAQIVKLLDGHILVVPGFETHEIHWQGTTHRRNPDAATLRQSTAVFEIELRPVPEGE